MGRRYIPFHPNVESYRRHYSGSGLPVFRGVYNHHGHGLGGIFSSILKTVVPILKKTAVPFLKQTGKKLLSSGVRAIGDVVSGDTDIKTAIKRVGQESIRDIGQNVKQQVVSGVLSGLRRKASDSDDFGNRRRGTSRKLRKTATKGHVTSRSRKRKGNRNSQSGGNLFLF